MMQSPIAPETVTPAVTAPELDGYVSLTDLPSGACLVRSAWLEEDGQVRMTLRHHSRNQYDVTFGQLSAEALASSLDHDVERLALRLSYDSGQISAHELRLGPGGARTVEIPIEQALLVALNGVHTTVHRSGS